MRKTRRAGLIMPQRGRLMVVAPAQVDDIHRVGGTGKGGGYEGVDASLPWMDLTAPGLSLRRFILTC